MSTSSCDRCGVGARSFCVGGCANEAEREAVLMGPSYHRPKLVFAIDYDGTFSADPAGFRALVELLRARGHTCVLVTGRSDEGEWGAQVKRSVGDLMPIVFAAGAWKTTAAERAGFKVNIWIDDSPEGIRELPESVLAFKRQQDAALRGRR